MCLAKPVTLCTFIVAGNLFVTPTVREEVLYAAAVDKAARRATTSRFIFFARQESLERRLDVVRYGMMVARRCCSPPPCNLSVGRFRFFLRAPMVGLLLTYLPVVCCAGRAAARATR